MSLYNVEIGHYSKEEEKIRWGAEESESTTCHNVYGIRDESILVPSCCLHNELWRSRGFLILDSR